MAEQVSSLKTGIKYKDTPIGRIPMDWEVVRLGDICSISSGEASNYSKDIHENKYPVYGSNGVIGSYDNSNFSDGLIIGRVGASGSINAVSSPIWASDNTLLLSITDKFIQKLFVYYYLQNCNLPALATKTAQPLMTQQTLKSVLIAVPNSSEQNKIAEILTTMDEAIEKTGQIIEKTKEVKKGLIQKILTRGIGHKKFKKTEIGAIPEEWEVIPMKKILIKGHSKDPRNFSDQNFKYVDISSVSNEIFKITGYQVFEGKNAPSRARKELKYKDIIYATVRPYLKRIAIVPKELDGEICSTGFCVVRCNDKLSNFKYIFYLLQTDWITERLTNLQRGSNYPAITDNDLYNQVIPTPDAREQKEIGEILSSIDDRIEKESNNREQLQVLKKGLMQVLLTGKIRVIV